MIRIGVCDDNALAFERIERDLRDFLEQNQESYTLQMFQGGEALLEFCKDTRSCLDLVFMDIEMPGMNGIEAATRIHEYQPHCQIAFNTNYLAYASDVYETEHCYYILKDEFAKRLPDVFRKYKESKKRNRIYIRTKNGIERIYVQDILYVERRLKKSYICMREGNEIVTSYPLEKMMEQLEAFGFGRCHTSYIVSFEKIRKYRDGGFEMDDERFINISRKFSAIKKDFLVWAGNQI